MLKWFQRQSIFKKILLAFAVVVIMPQILSYYITQRTAGDLIVQQNITETINSLMLVSNSVDTLLQRAYSTALYVSNSENVRQMLAETTEDNTDAEQLERINRFSALINNLAFNMIEVRSYITITDGRQKFVNWPYTGAFSEGFYRYKDEGTSRIWTGFEPNYVASDARTIPYVWTVGQNMNDPVTGAWQGAFIISIPERAVANLLSADDLQTRLILDENNRIISSTQMSLLGQYFDAIYDTPLPSRYGFVQTQDADGQDILISFVPMRNWRIADIKQESYIVQQLYTSRQNLLIINFASILAFVAISAFLAKRLSRPLEKRFVQDAKQKREAELKALQAQISPHFLFNTLTNIRWAAINNNNQKAADMTLALSNLLRMTIINGDEFITLEAEIDNLRHYIKIFQMRQGADINFNIEIPDELKSYPIPKLLLQPIVENALIHGFADINRTGSITVMAMSHETGVTITIEDNGSGMDMEKPMQKGQKFSGIGIDNVQERIKLNYGENYGLEIESVLGEGTVIKLALPPKDEGLVRCHD